MSASSSSDSEYSFIVNHIYSAWLMDIKEHGSEISSMFSGYKFTVHKEKE